jgi:soluble lytic murein transglycosylase
MQLMPGTAARVAKLLGEEYDREAAYTPAVNLRYGIHYLSLLLQKFGGSPLLAAGAYNAGPGAVEEWLGMQWTGRMDLFVELIPPAQTRSYVRRVVTSLVRYRFLDGGAPEELLGDCAASPAAPKGGEKLF